MVATIKNIISREILSISISAVLVLFGLSGAANAAQYFGTLKADAGDYAPIVMGEDITLDACGSAFESSETIFPSYNLCTMPTAVGIDFSWTVLNTFNSGSQSFTGQTVTLATGGIGDFVNALGTYVVTLNVVAARGRVVLAGAGVGLVNSSASDSTGFSVSAGTTVPEPSAALLLLPAMAVIVGRQRRRRRKIEASTKEKGATSTG